MKKYCPFVLTFFLLTGCVGLPSYIKAKGDKLYEIKIDSMNQVELIPAKTEAGVEQSKLPVKINNNTEIYLVKNDRLVLIKKTNDGKGKLFYYDISGTPSKNKYSVKDEYDIDWFYYMDKNVLFLLRANKFYYLDDSILDKKGMKEPFSDPIDTGASEIDMTKYSIRAVENTDEFYLEQQKINVRKRYDSFVREVTINFKIANDKLNLKKLNDWVYIRKAGKMDEAELVLKINNEVADFETSWDCSNIADNDYPGWFFEAKILDSSKFEILVKKGIRSRGLVNTFNFLKSEVAKAGSLLEEDEAELNRSIEKIGNKMQEDVRNEIKSRYETEKNKLARNIRDIVNQNSIADTESSVFDFDENNKYIKLRKDDEILFLCLYKDTTILKGKTK